MNPVKRFFSFLFLGIAMLIIACSVCSKDDEEENESKVVVITSTGSGSIEAGDFSMDITPGSVPPNQNGQAGTISFSIETGVDAPQALPAGVTAVSNYVFLGPDGFQFSWPIRVTFPGRNASSAQGLYIFQYDPSNEDWKVILPSYIDSVDKKVGGDVLNLGYCVLGQHSVPLAKPADATSNGGIKYTGSDGYYYSLTVETSTFKYPASASWIGSANGYTFASGQLYAAGGPNPTVRGHLPQGSYTFWVSRTQPGTLSQLPKVYTYSVVASATIDKPLEYWGWGNINESSWTTLTLPSGGEWREGSPSEWGDPTATYGTGDFQATLTWVNTQSSATDIDLHLYRTVNGQQDMHIYYWDKTSSDGSFQLDRDWLEKEGNAVENIYSLTTPLPKGQYKLTVHHFSGSAPKQFNVRVIRNYSVRNYTNSLTDDQEITITTFTID